MKFYCENVATSHLYVKVETRLMVIAGAKFRRVFYVDKCQICRSKSCWI